MKIEIKKKKVILGVLFLMAVLVMQAFPVNIEVGITLGSYAKSDELFKELYGAKSTVPGFGAVFFFTRHVGFFFDVGAVSHEGISTYDNTPLTYKETHFALGLQYRLPLYSFSDHMKVECYFKGGSLFLKYSETFDEKGGASVPGLYLGGGVLFRWKKFGVGIEIAKNYSYEEIEIQGLDIVESIDFSGFRLSIKGTYTF